MGVPTRPLAAVLLALGLLVVAASGVALLASQPPGAVAGVLLLPEPWIALRETALGHALVLGLLGGLGWLPGPEAARRTWVALLVALLLVHGAQCFGAVHSSRLVVLWPLNPALFAATVARWTGHFLFAAVVLRLLLPRLRRG